MEETSSLLGLRSRTLKLQETLHNFLLHPNLPWLETLDKFNMLSSQFYNLTHELSLDMKNLALYPQQTLPDPLLSTYYTCI
jgi:hypothetical protein